jgi:hypothetical protein
MKKLCFIVLIAFIFGDISIPKYGSAKSYEESDVFYFKTSDFNDGSSIYFQLNAENGFLHYDTVYEFSDDSPISGFHFFTRAVIITTYSRGNSQTSVNGKVTSYCEKYYYEIKNDRKCSYLYIKYTGFIGDFLEAESTRLSVGAFILIIVIIVVGTIILIVVAVIIIRIIKLKRDDEQYINRDNTNYNTPQYQTQTQNPNPDFTPDSYNSNYPQQQQGQNIYYEPPTVRPLN